MKKPDHPTTGEIVVRDYEAGKIEDLAAHIDRLLNKELEYGISVGTDRKAMGVRSTWSALPPIREKDGETAKPEGKVRKVGTSRRKKA